jgi:hypothetical protein
LRVGFWSGISFPSGFSTKLHMHFPYNNEFYIFWPHGRVWYKRLMNYLNSTKYKAPIHEVFDSPHTTSHLPVIFLCSTLFSNTPNMSFSFRVNDQVSNPFRTGKTVRFPGLY